MFTSTISPQAKTPNKITCTYIKYEEGGSWILCPTSTTLKATQIKDNSWMKLNWKSRDFLTIIIPEVSLPKPRQSLKELVNTLQQIKQTNFLISKLCYSAVRML